MACDFSLWHGRIFDLKTVCTECGSSFSVSYDLLEQIDVEGNKLTHMKKEADSLIVDLTPFAEKLLLEREQRIKDLENKLQAIERRSL
jgi:hypothetical protein